jgi:hypothetical protein
MKIIKELSFADLPPGGRLLGHATTKRGKARAKRSKERSAKVASRLDAERELAKQRAVAARSTHGRRS